MSGEINPKLKGDVESRAQENKLSSTGKRKFQQIGFEELTLKEEAITPTQDVEAIKVEGSGTLKTIGHTQKGHILTLRFGGTVTVKNGASIILNALDMRAVASDTLTLVCGDTDWREISRTERSRAEELTAAETISPSATVNTVKINGTTTIKKVTATYNGHLLVLRFGESVTVEGSENLRLNASFSATVNDTLTLLCNGTNFYEVARSANT